MDIHNVYKSPGKVPEMVTYFVTQTVSDGLPATDFNTLADDLFKCGHAQNIHVCTTSEALSTAFQKCCIYKVMIHLDSS